MSKKVCVVITFVILTAMISPLFSYAKISDGPQVQDRIRDVKLFGIFRLFPQEFFKHIDVVSSWFNEDIENPDYLFVSLKLRDLNEKTDTLEAIYTVRWIHNNNFFISGIHVFPQGLDDFYIGTSMDGDSVVDNYYTCEGSFNLEEDTITWMVPKNILGNLQQGSIISDIHPSAYLRFPYESGFPMIDLFKDFSYNAKTTTEYIVQL